MNYSVVSHNATKKVHSWQLTPFVQQEIQIPVYYDLESDPDDNIKVRYI